MIDRMAHVSTHSGVSSWDRFAHSLAPRTFGEAAFYTGAIVAALAMGGIPAAIGATFACISCRYVPFSEERRIQRIEVPPATREAPQIARRNALPATPLLRREIPLSSESESQREIPLPRESESQQEITFSSESEFEPIEPSLSSETNVDEEIEEIKRLARGVMWKVAGVKMILSFRLKYPQKEDRRRLRAEMLERLYDKVHQDHPEIPRDSDEIVVAARKKLEEIHKKSESLSTKDLEKLLEEESLCLKF